MSEKKIINKSPIYKRIAVEESWTIPEIFDDMREIALSNPKDEPGMASLWAEVMRTKGAKSFGDVLCDTGVDRLTMMDNNGIDIQVLSMTAPGVQMYSDKVKAVTMSRIANDRLYDAIKINPDRFFGLAAVAPQVPIEAVKEIDRAINQLGYKGVIINSHTKGEYLDEEKFWPILEAIEALNIPLYLHPRTPAGSMIEPYAKYPLEGAIFGFSAEASLHAMRLMISGIFDRFPKLKIVLGHLGEGLPFFMTRFNVQYDEFVLQRSESPRAKPLQRSLKEYFLDNFVVSTSGMNWENEIMYCQKVLGADRIMFAADHPFESTTEAVTNVNKLPLSDKDMKKLYQTNAERIFSL